MKQSLRIWASRVGLVATVGALAACSKTKGSYGAPEGTASAAAWEEDTAAATEKQWPDKKWPDKQADARRTTADRPDDRASAQDLWFMRSPSDTQPATQTQPAQPTRFEQPRVEQQPIQQQFATPPPPKPVQPVVVPPQRNWRQRRGGCE